MDTAFGTPSTSVEWVEVAHRLLTIKEAAAEVRVCLSHVYELAHEYLNSGGTSGLPVLRFGTFAESVLPRGVSDGQGPRVAAGMTTTPSGRV